MAAGPARPDPGVPLLVVAGPTGVGKSALAIDLALRLGGEIVNFDSVQIYRGFDIGSAKPSGEERARVRHHLFDFVEPEEIFTAAGYARRADEAIAEISARGAIPILVGGTFFYLRALLAGLPEMPPRDPELRRRIRRIASTPRGRDRLHRWLARVDPQSAARIAPADTHRVERALEVWLQTRQAISAFRVPHADSTPRHASVKVALARPRPLLIEALDRRVDLMYEMGLVGETRELLAHHPRDSRPFSSIGYREAVRHLDGEIALGEAVHETKRRTRAYAKRQMTWLRAERHVEWLDATRDYAEILHASLELWKKATLNVESDLA